jgi:hypothetical protein
MRNLGKLDGWRGMGRGGERREWRLWLGWGRRMMGLGLGMCFEVWGRGQ